MLVAGSGKDIVLRPLLQLEGIKEITPTQLLSKQKISDTPLIINGLWEKFITLQRAKTLLEDFGYTTAIVFVTTSNEVSKQRNEARQYHGRVINESVRYQKWFQSNS